MNHLETAKTHVEAIQACLPASVDPAMFNTPEKGPHLLTCTREALIWRVEELGRSACNALDRADFAVAAILTRAVTEAAALMWKLSHLLDKQPQEISPDDYKTIGQAFVGSRAWEDMPKSLQILTLLDNLEKRSPGVRKAYDLLSEYAHPNWMGVIGLYSEIDHDSLIVNFGRGFRDPDGRLRHIAHLLSLSLGTFLHFYNRFADLMPGYISNLKRVWQDNLVKTAEPNDDDKGVNAT